MLGGPFPADTRARAADLDAPPVTTGLVLFGSIVPTLSLLPVVDGIGAPSAFGPGRDVVSGFDVRGRRLFRRTFADKIYNFYVFLDVDRATIQALTRLRVEIGGRAIERSATRHGPPAANAHAIGAQRVRITWDAQAFPRLACHDDAGGSPAPLMLSGDFTAADIRSATLRCDFSDGVKTAYAGVRVPVVAAAK